MKTNPILRLAMLAIAFLGAVFGALLAPLAQPAKAIGQQLHDALFGYLGRAGLVLGMATLAANKPRTAPLADLNDLPMIAADIIYEGAAVGDNGAGLARPLVAQDPFLGFAESKADNSAGAASAINVRVRSRGYVEIPVVGAASADDQGATVYASDDDTFTLTSTSNTSIGKVVRWVSGTTCVVYFEAVALRSL
jgi:predicted lipid-binding transport protein (Tim44 family)